MEIIFHESLGEKVARVYQLSIPVPHDSWGWHSCQQIKKCHFSFLLDCYYHPIMCVMLIFHIVSLEDLVAKLINLKCHHLTCTFFYPFITKDGTHWKSIFHPFVFTGYTKVSFDSLHGLLLSVQIT